MLNVVCVKIGSRYGPEYVNKLHSMLSRHLQLPFKLHCLTERRIGITEAVDIITPPQVLEGWWNKLYLFSDFMPAGPLLYLDLDQVILGNLTEIVQECLKHAFSCYADHIEWLDCKFGSAFMTFQAGAHRDIYERFQQERPDRQEFPGGDQVWVYQTGLLPEVFYFNEQWPNAVKSYKFDILPTGKPPAPEVKIANFHGLPKPVNVAGVRWVKENWV